MKRENEVKELIFVDTETTGLYADQDQIVELSWAKKQGPIKTLYFGVESVPSFIDDLIGFTKRGIAGKKSSDREIADFLSSSEGNTMVAANPAFDKGFLVAADLFRFHYRMLDIESYAMAKLDLTEMPGLKDIQNQLRDGGFRISEPNHTSAGDVKAMRESWHALNGL